MSTPNRIGLFPGPFQKNMEVRENTRTGSITVFTFEGVYNECLMERDWARQAGASEISFTAIGDGNWQLIYSFPTGENGVEPVPVPGTHELETCIEYVSIYQGDLLKALLSDQTIGEVGRTISRFKGGILTTDAAEAEITAIAAQPEDAAGSAMALFKTVAYYDTEQFIQYYSVYRRTLTAATPDIVIASYEGVGTIWTSDEVLKFEGLPPDGWFQLEEDAQWLKSKPQVAMVANQKTQVTYSYTQGYRYNALCYAPYDSATLWLPT